MSSHPSIEVHALCWNESQLLPLFLSHYSELAEKIVVWDNCSDDGSDELVRGCPKAELRKFDTGQFASEDRGLEIKNQGWKGTKADWVVICDLDELVYHPQLADYLLHSDADVLRCDGFNVTGPRLPRRPDLAQPIWKGQYNPWYSKPILFRPAIGEIRFAPGSHGADPPCEIKPSPVKLLHCQFLRSCEEFIARIHRLRGRRSPHDLERGYGAQYLKSEEEIRESYRHVVLTAFPFPVIDRVRAWQAAGATSAQLVELLNAENISTPEGYPPWNEMFVERLFGSL